jgi:hypothetical protein
MTSGAHASDGRFVEVGWGLPLPSSGPPRCSLWLSGILGAEVDDT